MISRRDFLKLSGVSSLALYAAARGNPLMRALAASAKVGLSDPALQPKFANPVPDALSPGFIYQPDKHGRYKVQVGATIQETGLIDPATGIPLQTPVWGYGAQSDGVFTWPGRTFQVKSVSAGGPPETEVVWANALNGVTQHLLPVDTSLHWCYSLPGYDRFTIEKQGVPLIAHLHGGHTDFQFDGNPEFFYGPPLNKSGKQQVVGPQWDFVPGGFTTKFRYDNNVRAGNLWYHDHALGLTRLNVYAGLAGFYFVRDEFDTGEVGNPLDLPAWPYEKAYAIQDRMFYDTGELFYPAFPDDPYYDDFIYGEVGEDGLPDEFFPDGGPSALAEFFGDHMVVNGVIWPLENVEPRNYRMHLLNGTDSRFMAIQFFEVPAGATDFTFATEPLPFDVIGSDQGLASSPTNVTTLLSEPGSRYDIIVDFKNVTPGNRVIMKNIGGDEPFGGDIPGPQVYGETDRIMAFDVVLPLDAKVADVSPTSLNGGPNVGEPTVTRQVALFEGKDEFGRLQPLLGAFTGTEFEAIPWHMATTENPALGSTEIWEIYNFTGDAHPVHLHLVHFEILGRQAITFDADDEENHQVILQHNGALGMAPRISNIELGDAVYLTPEEGYVENAPKDMVTALPEQITRIKATFDKPGRYVWHCHILSHEDHEMMRVLHVGPGA